MFCIVSFILLMSIEFSCHLWSLGCQFHNISRMLKGSLLTESFFLSKKYIYLKLMLTPNHKQMLNLKHFLLCCCFSNPSKDGHKINLTLMFVEKCGISQIYQINTNIIEKAMNLIEFFLNFSLFRKVWAEVDMRQIWTLFLTKVLILLKFLNDDQWQWR